MWEEVAQTFAWSQPWKTVQSGSLAEGNSSWFTEGKTNLSINCLDRHLEENGDKIALIWEPNNPDQAPITYTYTELHHQVVRAAAGLRAQGVKKGDRVCLYLPMIPELVISMLACARIGAVHSVVFSGFSARSLKERIIDSGATVIITADQSNRGTKKIPLLPVVKEAVEQNIGIRTIVVVTQLELTAPFITWDAFIHAGNEVSGTAEEMDSEDPLFILYTSGSTGKPKGLLHTTGGYMVNAGHTFKKVFDYKPEDIYWCTADAGWITGHTYVVYGPLLNAATVVLFEGVPTWPSPGRFWEIIEKHAVSIFYTAPTAIRALEKEGDQWPKRCDLSSLRILGTVGEPINEEAWYWYHRVIGNGTCFIVDTWWQTETGAIMITPLPGTKDVRPGYASDPLPGIEVCLVDDQGKEVIGDGSGSLCIKSPWPSLARTIWGDHDRYKQTYLLPYPGMYFTGDGALRSNGKYRITGRIDDVLNVSGHRLSTGEIEDAIDEHPLVVESAVVGYPHPVKGQGIYAFVILNDTGMSPVVLEEEIRSKVSNHISPIAKPDIIQFVPDLPKTRSGKIMRRILRKIASGETNYGDTSTLLDPIVVGTIIEGSLNRE